MAVACLTGCNALKTSKDGFMAPWALIKSSNGSPINPILKSMNAMDEREDLPPNASFPVAADLIYDDSDYVLGSSDVINVSILDLIFESGETAVQRTVSDGGYVDLPLLDERVKAAGRTKRQLRKDFIKAYVDANMLTEDSASISIEIVLRRNSFVTVFGAVVRPGTYPLPRRDTRLLDIIAMAEGRSQSNIDFIYVIRHPRAMSRSEIKAGGPVMTVPTIDIDPVKNGKDLDSALDELRKGLEDALDPSQSIMRFSMNADGSPTADTAPGTKGEPKWQRRDGKWVLKDGISTNGNTRANNPKVIDDGPVRNEDDPFGFSQTDYKQNSARVIAINLKQLENGDPRMNIIIQDRDIINIPSLDIGEFYMYGAINAPGVYSLTGRKMTVKMAVTAARGFAFDAWPENTVLVRRIGPGQEQQIPLNLEKIFSGEEPDLFLKPDDVLAIGTNWKASFLAVFRNAFRMTYGFGFIYDRNLANPLFDATSKRFTRW